MRMLMIAELDTFMANEALKSGRLPKLMEEVMTRLNPESAYFTVNNGRRTAYIVFDLEDVADMPMSGEPFFLELGASLNITPVMTAEDLGRGLGRMGELGR